MSYLETLMKTDPPAGDYRKGFIKCQQEPRTIVPIIEDNNTLSQEDVEGQNKERKPFRKTNKNSSQEVGEDQNKESKPFRNTNKNSLRKPDSKYESSKKTSGKTDRDPSYSKAFQNAQESLVKSCRPSKDDHSIISQSIKYIHNWNGHHVKVDVTDDDIVINMEEKEFKFSKKRFLSNRNFQRDVIDEYASAYGNVYLKFFQKKDDDDTYTIHVKAGR